MVHTGPTYGPIKLTFLFEMFVTISSMSALVRPLSSVSFHVHLQVCPLENGLAHSSHAESLSPVCSDHVDHQTLPT